MKITIDSDRHDLLQEHLIATLMQAVREELKDSKVPAPKIRLLTETIGFRVACILDGSHEVKADGVLLSPIVGFGVEDKNNDLIAMIHSKDFGTVMQEYVYIVSDELFGEQPPSKPLKKRRARKNTRAS